MSKQVFSGVTFKSFMMGMLCSFLIAVGAPYGDMIPKTAGMATDAFTPGAIFLLFALVGVVNVLLKAMERGFRLNFRLSLASSELMVVYVMMIVASAIPTMGLSESFFPLLTGAFYYATPENEWAELIHPYIKPWMVPQSKEVIWGFYEGLSKGESIPWGAWARPLFYWSVLLLTLYFVSICMMVILRKQWVERERLLFPLVQLPQEMLVEDEKGSLINPFFKNGLMWLGFAIPSLFLSWNALHNYFHFIPPITLRWDGTLFRRTTSISYRVLFVIIGFSYLLNLDVAFSLWFFHLVGVIQTGVFNMTGFSVSGFDPFFHGDPSIAHQNMGGMIVLVLFGLWMARGHLKAVFRKAFRKAPEMDDSGELLSYRTAVWGVIIGLGVMSFWLRASGIPLLLIPMFLFACFVILLALTRMVCEGGVAFLRTSLIPQAFVIRGVGTSAVGMSGLTGLAYSFVWLADIRTFVMVHCADGLKLASTAKLRTRPLFWSMMAAIVVSMAGSFWMILKLSYTYGGINLSQWYFVGAPQYPFTYIADLIHNPIGVSGIRWMFTGLGAGVMGFLMFMRYRFLWWPLHPLGFPLAESYPLQLSWFSIFIAWLLKSIILKYGGVKLYRRLRPFFLGLVLGHICVAAFWLVVDTLTGMTENYVPFQ